jgi:hypothetical protein
MLGSPLALPQSATPFVRWAYRRADVFAAQPATWAVKLADLEPDGARVVGLEPAYGLPWPTSPVGGVLVPWEKIVALRIDADGRAEVVTLKRDS